MRRGRLALFVVGAAAAASQAGHLIAFQLRFGAAAQQLQAAGVHAYFPQLAKTLIGASALAALAALAIVAAARVASGRRIEKSSAPSPMRLLAVLFTVQLAIFAVQETVEALLGGAHVASAGELLLWGTIGQLPVAVVAAFALRWLAARVEPALWALRVRPAVTYPAALAPAFAARPLATAAVSNPDFLAGHSRRGPPAF